MVFCQASTGISSIWPRSSPCGAPALFTKISKRPKRSIVCATNRAASASSETSPTKLAAWPPAASISAVRVSRPCHAAGCAPASVWSFATPPDATSDTATMTPSAANRRAVAAPMPFCLPQPVISATRPSDLSSHTFVQAKPASRPELSRIRNQPACSIQLFSSNQLVENKERMQRIHQDEDEAEHLQ